ncbi:MAG TPA: HNH endonuclease family protein [Acidimicrobiales bacterium]|jgi:hypothetical protein|nr:HNH endonuclease family protein [Acidimicrobiales bacterium]
MRRWLSKLDDALLVVVLAGGSWWGYGQLTDTEAPAADQRAVAGADASSGDTQAERTHAIDLLRSLEVKWRAPKTGYRRDAFGQRWADIDGNGCDTRNDVLKRDLERVVFRPGSNACVVESGVLIDPYTASRIDFVKRNATSTAVQIDHAVALSDAWQKGAQTWTDEKRLQFANDPLNLLAIGDAANRQKGDSDAASWLPANKAFRCEYVARQVRVKAKDGVWVTEAERDQIERVLEMCPGQPPPAA